MLDEGKGGSDVVFQAGGLFYGGRGGQLSKKYMSGGLKNAGACDIIRRDDQKIQKLTNGEKNEKL